MAIKVEFGKCAQCNENNSKLLKFCRKCNAPLPWAKAAKPIISKASAPPVRTAPKPSMQIDWGTFGVGAISFLMPIIGFFLYSSYSKTGDDKGSVALIAAILGVLTHIARIALRASATAG